MSTAVLGQPFNEPVDRRGLPELLRSVSASRLTSWLQCRLKFWFRYLSGIAKPKPVALHVGGSVHEVLKAWNRARWHKKVSTLKELHDAYAAAWATQQKKEPVRWDAGKEDEEKKTGWRLLETYFRESPIDSNEKPEAVEVSVEADLSGHGLPKLVGIIDLVRPGGRIVDFKTSGKTPDAEMVRHTTEAQLTGYSVL